MSDQSFDEFGDWIEVRPLELQAEPTAVSRFLTRSGVTAFWLLFVGV
jgi:hypothetical protein